MTIIPSSTAALERAVANATEAASALLDDVASVRASLGWVAEDDVRACQLDAAHGFHGHWLDGRPVCCPGVEVTL